MKGDPSRDDVELHAAADGQLPAARAEALAARLAADGEAAARVDFYRRLNDGLHRLYDPLLAEPHDLRPARPARAGLRLAPAAAAVLLLLAGAGAGWLGRGWFDGAARLAAIDLPRLAADAHLVYAAEVRHPVEVGADQEAHLVQWLSKRLGTPVIAPNLEPQGYRLIGGRLLPAGGADLDGAGSGRAGPGRGVAGQFMYENLAGTRLTLFLVSGGSSEESAFHFTERDGVSVFYWRDGGFGYALSAALPREALLPLCNEIYAQLNPGGPVVSW